MQSIFGFCHFPESSGQLRKNQTWSIRSKRLSCNWGENFWLSQKERFLELIKKALILLITCELISATMSIALFWWSQRFIFPLLYVTSVLLLKRSQPSSIVWTVTSTAAFYHCWSFTKHSDLWIRFAAYIWYQFDIFITIYANLFDFLFDKCQQQA